MTKTNIRKRAISILLILMVMLTMTPMTASAGEMLPFHEVETYQELIDAVHSGKPRIKLKNDINTRDVYASGIGIPEDNMITIGYDAAITLDLNGCTLALETLVRGGFSFFTVYGELEIKDSTPSQNGKITGKFPSHLASMFRTQGGTLTLQSGTLMTSSNKNDVITVGGSGHVVINGGRICSGKWDTSSGSPCGYAVLAVTDFADVEKMEVIINDGVFDGAVGFFPRSEFTCKEPRFHIYGGTFKQDVLLRCGQKTFKTHSPILEICGGSFEGGLKIYDWGMDPIDRYGDAAQSYPPFKLLGGTFSCTVDLCYEKSYWGFDSPKLDQFIGALKYERMRPVFAAMLENSAIVKPSDTYTAVNIDKGMDWALREGYGTYYQMLLKGTAFNPVRIIPNAWGMKSVTLDGDSIDYAKDFKGEVKEITNSTAHTLKFEWYPLAQELKDAGYTYRANFDCYTVGSNTPTSVPISATAAEYSHTIPAGEAPSVYPFDLQLNLDKNGSSVGIIGNQHIVKLVVNPAPVVTEISSAPVRLSAALTPDGTAPSATPVGSDYTVDSIKWYTNNECTTEASSFVAGTEYYGKIVLKPKTNYKFAASASAVPFCDDPNENYSIVGSSTVAEGGSSLTLIVKGTAVSALVWDTVKTNTDDKTYTIGDSALTLNAKATGGDSSKPISYKLIAKKGGTETVKASAMVAASASDSFSAPLRFTDTGSYECWFEATRGNVTITSDHFTVTVNAPGLSITNQSGDLTVKQNGTARLFVKAAGHGVKYQWQDKNGETWDDISSATDYDYAASTADAGEKTYRCKVTDNYGATKYTNEMTVTVTEVADSSLTPAIPLAAVNGDAPDPAEKWPSKDVPANIWLSQTAQYNVTAGEAFHGVATFSTIPKGFTTNHGSDIYYGKTPVLGTISYEWKGTTAPIASATSHDFSSLGTDAHASFTIPSGVDTYYVVLSVKNTIGEGPGNQATSTVTITFNVSAAHTHTHSYAYAQLDATSHTKYCTAGDDSITETHTTENGVCKYCGYALATYSVNVTNGSADYSTNVAPGTKVTLNADNAPTGQEFDNWVGNVTVASDNTFNMPSHNVTVAATYKPTAHAHDTDAQPWVCMDPGTHIKTCTAGDDFKVEAHTWQWVVDAPATSTTAGSKHEKCTKCTATRNANTVIPATGGGSSGGGSYAPTTQKPEITIIGSGKAELSADGKTATITAAAGYELASVVLNGKEMGKVEKLTGLKTGDKATITFRAKAGEKDGKEETDKMIAREVSKLRLTARSARTAKKNVKLVVKSDLKAITDAGYTVKYKFYRSTKKSAGYKAMKTGKSGIYINTYGKKGTMYYYKARVMIYDKDGNFVAQTALKQCKYANRLWTK